MNVYILTSPLQISNAQRFSLDHPNEKSFFVFLSPGQKIQRDISLAKMRASFDREFDIELPPIRLSLESCTCIDLPVEDSQPLCTVGSTQLASLLHTKTLVQRAVQTVLEGSEPFDEGRDQEKFRLVVGDYRTIVWRLILGELSETGHRVETVLLDDGAVSRSVIRYRSGDKSVTDEVNRLTIGNSCGWCLDGDRIHARDGETDITLRIYEPSLVTFFTVYGSEKTRNSRDTFVSPELSLDKPEILPDSVYLIGSSHAADGLVNTGDYYSLVSKVLLDAERLGKHIEYFPHRREPHSWLNVLIDMGITVSEKSFDETLEDDQKVAALLIGFGSTALDGWKIPENVKTIILVDKDLRKSSRARHIETVLLGNLERSNSSFLDWHAAHNLSTTGELFDLSEQFLKTHQNRFSPPSKCLFFEEKPVKVTQGGRLKLSKHLPQAVIIKSLGVEQMLLRLQVGSEEVVRHRSDGKFSKYELRSGTIFVGNFSKKPWGTLPIVWLPKKPIWWKSMLDRLDRKLSLPFREASRGATLNVRFLKNGKGRPYMGTAGVGTAVEISGTQVIDEKNFRVRVPLGELSILQFREATKRTKKSKVTAFILGGGHVIEAESVNFDLESDYLQCLCCHSQVRCNFDDPSIFKASVDTTSEIAVTVTPDGISITTWCGKRNVKHQLGKDLHIELSGGRVTYPSQAT